LTPITTCWAPTQQILTVPTPFSRQSTSGERFDNQLHQGPHAISHAERNRWRRPHRRVNAAQISYSPESNGMAEAFVKTFKRDYVYLHRLESAATVLAQLSAWFEDYNEVHPHRGLKMRSPREYRRLCEGVS
jgi:Integrase core domain